MNTDTPWIKAEASASSGDCVEMARKGGEVRVRDSKDPNGLTLGFTKSEFRAWLDGAKRGEFDHLAD